MQTSWPLLDLLAFSQLRSVTSAMVIDAAQRMTSLEDAVEQHALLFPSADHAVGFLREQAASVLADAQRSGAQIITPFDEAFPASLLSAQPMPAFIYVRGTITHQPRIGVVGTRRSTDGYGRPVTTSFVRTWCEAGASIVSGLATGIDTFAHLTALDARAHTIAVVASGVDVITPAGAAALADRIVHAGGAIVSEYRCGLKAMPGYFPVRNRIITALSDAVVVVESDLTGGSMISVDFAVKQRRPIYAVPGSVLASRSAGPNALISRGIATCLPSADVLCDALGLRAQQRLSLSEPLHLSSFESQILACCAHGPTHADAIAATLDAAMGDVLSAILGLEFRGALRRLPGNVVEPCR